MKKNISFRILLYILLSFFISSHTLAIFSGTVHAQDSLYQSQQYQQSAGFNGWIHNQGSISVRLNPMDENHRSFILKRYAMAGKTIADSPDLFEPPCNDQRPINQKKRFHISKNATTSIRNYTNETDHQIVSLTVENGKIYASALSTVSGGSLFSYLDLVVFDETGQTQLTPVGRREEYLAGAKVVVSTVGELPQLDLPQLDLPQTVMVTSLEKTMIDDEIQYHFISEIMPVNTANNDLFNIDAPLDNDEDDIITVCLNQNKMLCDYDNTEEENLKIPFKGSLTLPVQITKSNILAEETFIKLIAAELIEPSDDIPPAEPLPAPGGTTNILIDDGYGVQTFSDHISIAPGMDQGSSIVSWDIPQQAIQVKNEQLLNYFSGAIWYLNIAVMIRYDTDQGQVEKKLSWALCNDPEANEQTSFYDTLPQIVFRR
ncbi:MAG: hypothetical protein GY874_17755 [Desulfobacteraceae bacterium]|nr:hypothetical protein [Desulfobacteraceae bacterium]